MQSYKNLGGNSGVAAFEIGPDYIIVRFNDHWEYTYTYASAGAFNIDEMKRLALYGKGLNTFINQRVRKMYSDKRR